MITLTVLLIAISVSGQQQATRGPDPAAPNAKAQPPAPNAKAQPPAPNAKAQPPVRSSSRPSSSKTPLASSGTSGRSKPAEPPPVRILTKEEMDRRRSPFLLPPGGRPGDRYAEPDDQIPPWRQASFFGIRARGQFFIYVIDGSGSMIDENRFPRATIELRRSVAALRAPQKFEVIFYDEEATPMPGGPMPRSVDFQSRNLLRSWLELMEPAGGTDPRPALRLALGMRPDAIFLLSDGAFPDRSVEEIAQMNRWKIPIHCVDLSGGLAGDQLRRIAQSSGGQYAARGGPAAEHP